MKSWSCTWLTANRWQDSPDQEAFVYSNIVKGRELKVAELSLAPIIIQYYIQPKIDLRVTVVGESIYPVKILANGHGVEGDWRQIKDSVEFIECTLPEEISKSCVNLVKSLELSFGAIDLIESDNGNWSCSFTIRTWGSRF